MTIGVCPACGSKRIKTYKPGTRDFFCPRCEEVFYIEACRPEVCYRCERVIKDLTRATLMGNGKYKHTRCRRVRDRTMRLKEAAGAA